MAVAAVLVEHGLVSLDSKAISRQRIWVNLHKQGAEVALSIRRTSRSFVRVR
jgi:hypothetical protein